MDFSIPAQTQDILDRTQEFVETELYPLEADFLSKSWNEMLPTLDEKRKLAREKGLWLPQIEKEEGGLGLSLLEFGLMGAVLGKSPVGHYVVNGQAPDAGNMEILVKYASDEHKEKYLKPLLNGEIRSCFSMTEPEHAGSNPTIMSTTAVKDGDDYIINGHKWFTSSADDAAFAIVMAVTDPEQSPYTRASQIIVPTDTPGFNLIENTPCMGHRGEGWPSHSEIRYENCRVPQSNLLGPEGAGFMIAQERLGPGRIHHCMRWIGICERAFDLMCERALEREVAPERPLSSRQIIQGWIAECRAQIDAAKYMVLHAAWKIDNIGQKEAREEVHLIKFFVADVMTHVLDRAIQVHGGLGITDYTPLAMWYRNERAGHIYDGPDEVHKVAVTRRILQRYEGAKAK